MFKRLLTPLLALAFVGTLHAQSVWSDVPQSGIPAAGERRIQPSKSRAVQLDLSALRPVLAAAPERFSPAAESGNLPILSLPLPGGGTGRFQLEETPVMHPDLQAKYPEIRSYTGRGIDDPTAVLKCDLTPWGFHGMVRSARQGSFFIDPAVHGNTEFYVVYNKKDYLPKQDGALWTCGVPSPEGAQELEHGQPLSQTQFADFQGDTKLRRYRLALACTGEYAAFHGGTKPLVLAAMNTSMNRVNGVYENDFAVTMQIVANNDLLIYLNAATDPYSNADVGTMLGQNQTNCNNVIGIANYDIGHVYGTGDGGIAAAIGVVCGTSKAGGVTGINSPVGDPFDIDYVAHEMGHQFGGNHTFNNCFGNNGQASAVEPGSGTTIMAYAGICDANNVELHSEDFFHGYNIQEMGAFIYTGSGNTCAVKITTTNHNPDVNAGLNRTIPKSTPFALTAVGSDVDGDTLSYTWEQIDAGNAASPPTPTSAFGPLFRSFKGTASPTRIFPRLTDLVTNTNYLWEELPGVARSMNFRVVVRDNDWQAGCTDEDDVQITVAGTAGPFLVTAPNTNVVWTVGSPQTVTWNVANTTAAPVSCSDVRISLSLDGGFTYPVELAASVPNNGSANITVPNNVSNNCRVRVESLGNIFFDISNANFRIEPPAAPAFLLGTSTNILNVCAGENAPFVTTLTSLVGFTSPVTLSVTGVPAGATVNISPNPVTPTGSAVITLSNITPAMAGSYTLTLTGLGDTLTRTTTVALTLLPGAPAAAVASSPANGESGISTTATLTWAADPFASSYLVEVATNPSFSAGSIVSTQTPSGTSTVVGGLQIETVYYWRIRASNDCGAGIYSPISAFQTGKSLCGQNFSSTDVPKIIPEVGAVAPIESNLLVAQNKPINDMNLSIAFDHTWPGDVLGWLISPTQDTLLLFDQPGVPATSFGCNGDNANLIFDTQAAQDAAALDAQCNIVPPALSGTFQPIQSFDALNGKNALGQWKFVIGDTYPSDDGGAITAWSLSFCFSEAIAAGSILVNDPLSVVSGQSGAILQSHLDVYLSGIPEQGVFVLLSLPQHGILSLNGVPLALGGTFTQEDINNGVLVYTNNNDGSATDDFHFDALDQNNDAWVHDAVFNINVIANNLAASAAETNAILCNDGTTGQITVTATGLDGTYTYSLNGGQSQSSNVFNGLSAGTYTVVVTGQFGLTISTNPLTLANAAAIIVNTSVNADDLTVNASGGTGILEYSLDGVDFQASNEFLDLANGVYAVTVRDENGCTATGQGIVAVNSLLVSLNVQQTVSCAGGNNGELNVTVGGGQMPFSYSLNGGASQPSSVFSDLSAGTYTVVVTDNIGFSATSSEVVLSDPAALTVSTTVITNDIIVNASGGTGTLEYSIDGTTFQAGNQFSNRANGTYTLTVRDANGCTKTAQATVDVAPLSLSITTINLLCFGQATGSIMATATGGIPFYAYSLNGGPFQGGNFVNLAAGTYTVVAKDFEGNQVSVENIVISSPDQLLVNAVVVHNDATLTFSGGTPPYSFGSDAPNPDLQNLPNGTYHVTATDANGCVATTTFTVNVPPLLLTSTHTNVLCFGGSTGSITATATGGIPPYMYSLDNGPLQSSNVFPNVAAGVHTLVVSDANGTLTFGSVTVNQPNLLTVAGAVNSNSITATASGGTSPYQYSLNGGAQQSSGTFSGLSSGTYTVVTTDANGCTASVSNLVVMSGTIEPSEAWGLAVSPNPSTGLFVLTLQSAPDALRAEVFDATGRLLQSLELQPVGGQLTTTLDLRELPQGTYFLRLSDGENWGGVRLSKVGGQ
ncbi:MAG: reprolysin-like metallopeptidase [Saprospiraceae bacterium]